MLEISGYTYCRRCKRIAKLNYFVNINNKDISNHFDATVIDAVTEKKVSKICTSCGGQLEIVDSKMASIISLLNIKGYETVNCSAGNADKYGYEFPHITFKSVPAEIFNTLPDQWSVDLDADFDKNGEITIRYVKLPTKYDSFDFIQRELFMWVADLPFIGDPSLSSDDAKMRAFVEYFLDEKYWKISYSANYDVNTDLSVIPHKITIDKKFDEKKLKYDFCCSDDEYTETIIKIFGKSHYDAEKIAIGNNISNVKTPSYYYLKTFFPEFLDRISTLHGFNRDLFERMKSDKMTLLDVENRHHGFHNNDFLHRHFLNQYELFKYIKDRERDEK